MFEQSVLNIAEKYNQTIQKISERLGTTITLRNWTSLVYYPLVSARLADVPYPQGVDDKMINEVEDIANEIEPFFFANEYRKITGGNLIQKISVQLNQAIEQDAKNLPWPSRRVSLFSVDKAAFSGLLSTFTSKFGVAKFGDHLEIVLYEEDRRYYVEIYYNYDKQNDFCSSGSCTVEEFDA